jgi:arylamine N-acetyltransferase
MTATKKENIMTRVSASEHDSALKACAIIRAAWPDLPESTTVGTAENDVQNALTLLNELAGAHACNISMPQSRYTAAMGILTAPNLMAPCNLDAPEHTQDTEYNNVAICTTATGRRYGVQRVEGGWRRGYVFGATVADAMRGAAA